MSTSPIKSVNTVTVVLDVKETGPGEYSITEIPSDEFQGPELHSGNRKEINVDLPLPKSSIRGYYDVDDKQLGIYIVLLGSQVGPEFHVSVDQGIRFPINLLLYEGVLRVYKEESKLKVGIDVKIHIPFVSDVHTSFDIMDI